jgi:hypothetical protein
LSQKGPTIYRCDCSASRKVSDPDPQQSFQRTVSRDKTDILLLEEPWVVFEILVCGLSAGILLKEVDVVLVILLS